MGPAPISDLALEQKRAVGRDGGARLHLDLALELALKQGLETPAGRRWLGSGPGREGSKMNLQVGPD